MSTLRISSRVFECERHSEYSIVLPYSKDVAGGRGILVTEVGTSPTHLPTSDFGGLVTVHAGVGWCQKSRATNEKVIVGYFVKLLSLPYTILYREY